mmetsp:Transcript_86180/g.257229  ORF Transcript_86180/g.257229 Transcript_86180/m.257229 type:complete len:545 (+) Transcript_86180:82-1716(+)
MAALRRLFGAASRAGGQRHWLPAQALRGQSTAATTAASQLPAGDAGFRAALHEAGLVGVARQALERFGRYSENEVAWQRLGRQLLEDVNESSLGVGDLKALVRVLAEDVGLTQASFWEVLTSKAGHVLKTAELEELMELAEQYARIQAYSGDCAQVFLATFSKVRIEMAIHTMEPHALARLLAIFGRAGVGSRALSRFSAQLFNEMEERVLDNVKDFKVEDCLALVGSMARFRATKILVLQELGRNVLHERLPELQGSQISQLCSSYGELGWRHDTVFRDVAAEILQEHESMQRARISGQATGLVKYSASDIALVALAMLRLKMYRGNTSWFKWTDNYEELLDVLTRRMETELPSMCAKPLAAASFVLGRARRGSEELYKAMYERMVEILDGKDAGKPPADETERFRDPPQDELERFLHGLAMMGPIRKKDLDTQWLMQWLTKNVYTFVLSDFILVNRHLVAIHCYDREYLQMLVPFYCDEERAQQLKKSDVMELTNTYNGARIREDDIPEGLGRHFFWMLGRQFQRLHVDSVGSRRARVRRIG